MKKTKDVSKLVRQARRSLGLNGDEQQALLRKVRKANGLTNEQLARALDIGLPTLMAYLAAPSAKKHRKMPAALRLVLARMLEDQRRK